jgi:hypothetical protein
MRLDEGCKSYIYIFHSLYYGLIQFQVQSVIFSLNDKVVLGTKCKFNNDRESNSMFQPVASKEVLPPVICHADCNYRKYHSFIIISLYESIMSSES